MVGRRADVLADKNLLIAVRDEYLNVYWQGQSLFRADFKTSKIRVTTHPKFLLDPAMSKPVSFDGSAFAIKPLIEKGLVGSYEGVDTIKKMKAAAGSYSGVEKQGVHVIATRTLGIVDVEIALSTIGMETELVEEKGLGKIPRIDIGIVKETSEGPTLRFWEAKDFGNNDLRAKVGEPPVAGQIRKYEEMLAERRDQVVSSYRRVCHNLRSIAQMGRGQRTVAPVIEAVADGAELRLDLSGAVGLVVFGYSSSDKAAPSWKAHISKLEDPTVLGKSRIETAGSAAYVHL